MSPSISSFKDLVEVYAPTVPDFYFVQIGANDGSLGDPIGAFVRLWGWQGILVEPQRWLVEERLKHNYEGCEGLIFEIAAMDEEDGSREIFLPSGSRDRMVTGLATFHRERLLKHLGKPHVRRCLDSLADHPKGPAEEVLVSYEVPTLCFRTLLDRHRTRKIDLLQIDAEGEDHRLLGLFDFERWTPGIVQVEILQMSGEERAESRARLEDLGYVTFVDGINLVAVLGTIVDDLGLQIEAPSARPRRRRKPWKEPRLDWA